MAPVCAVVVAGGSGQRFGGGLRKQYLPVAGQTVLEHTLDRFEAHPQVGPIVLVLPKEGRPAELLAGHRLSVWWMALPAAGIAATRAFSHGGSAEELLLPFLAAALFSLVRALHSPGAKPLRAVCVQGLLAGCALWLKYTVLGFYLAWVVVLAALYLRRGWLAQLGRSVGAYLGGMALATLPWAVYFGVHGALGDWFTAYFYDNLFLYTGAGGGLPALAQHLWWAVRDGLPAALLLAAFLLWALLTRRFAAAGGVAALAAGLPATSLMGGYLVYYGLVLAVFARPSADDFIYAARTHAVVQQYGLDLLLEDDTYRTMTFDDYPVYYEMGEKTLPLAKNVVLKDSSADPQAEAVETTGASAVAAAINAAPDNWTVYNTTLVVQGGKVLEVRRIWVP